MSQVSSQTGHKLAELIRTADPCQETALEVIRELGVEGEKKTTLVVSRRQLNPEAPRVPTKLPSPKRAHTFYDIAGFCAYLKAFGSEHAVVLANPQLGRMRAILNERAEHGFEQIWFTPQLHPLFSPWAGLLDASKPVRILEFSDFVTRNRRVITDPPGTDLRLLLSQVRLSRSVELHQGNGKTSLNGIMVRTQVQSGSPDRSDYLDVPESMTIRVPIYLDSEHADVVIDLALGGNEQLGVMVHLSSPDLIQRKLELFDAMFARLRGEVERLTIGMGEPSTEEWKSI